MQTGNARLIYLNRLDWDEIRAITQRGTELLEAGNYDIHVRAQWRSMIEKCKRHRVPIDRTWLADPWLFARSWPKGAMLIVPSRGYLRENTTGPEFSTSHPGRAKADYDREFRHDSSAIFRPYGLEDISLRAADGSVLLPVVPESRKPWTGFPGGKQAFLRHLLQQAAGALNDMDAFEPLFDEIVEALEAM